MEVSGRERKHTLACCHCDSDGLTAIWVSFTLTSRFMVAASDVHVRRRPRLLVNSL
jgi:hypothetical protein